MEAVPIACLSGWARDHVVDCCQKCLGRGNVRRLCDGCLGLRSPGGEDCCMDGFCAQSSVVLAATKKKRIATKLDRDIQFLLQSSPGNQHIRAWQPTS